MNDLSSPLPLAGGVGGGAVRTEATVAGHAAPTPAPSRKREGSVRAAFAAAVADHILVKDGPYGTAVQALGLAEADYRGDLLTNHDQRGNNDILNLTRPAAMTAICDAYIAAGAELLATNTFSANRISQADYGCEALVADINRAAARITRDCCDRASAADGRRRFVLGAVGPTNKTLSISPRVEDPGFREVDFDGMADVYGEQIVALAEGGVDAILIETVFDTLNAKAGIAAVLDWRARHGADLPVMLSMTITDMAGRNLSGQTVEAFWYSVRHAQPLTVGLNCSFGATELRPYVQALAKVADCAVMVYPNAGLPNDMGAYDEAAETTGGLVGAWAREGLVNAVGGCCGTTPAHIAAMVAKVRGLPPRKLPDDGLALRLSGLEAYRFAA